MAQARWKRDPGAVRGVVVGEVRVNSAMSQA
jgi:hypothetical protein